VLNCGQKPTVEGGAIGGDATAKTNLTRGGWGQKKKKYGRLEAARRRKRQSATDNTVGPSDFKSGEGGGGVKVAGGKESGLAEVVWVIERGGACWGCLSGE